MISTKRIFVQKIIWKTSFAKNNIWMLGEKSGKEVTEIMACVYVAISVFDKLFQKGAELADHKKSFKQERL